MRHLGKTAPFIGLEGAPLPGSIAEVKYLRLGGVEQWVMIRGESVTNPPLILLHGGPGFGETSFFRFFNAELEKRFTVVYWEQRGAGRSFDPKLSRESMTVEQFVADLDQLVDAVCERLKKKKVVLYGHSWGSVLGVLYADRFPHKVAAYVGSGQIGDWRAAETASYTLARLQAQRRGKRRALAALRKIGPPPYDASAVLQERTWLQYLDGQLGPKALWKMGQMIFGAPESSLFDLPDALRGFRFTLDAMWADVSQINLIERVPALKVPVFFFLGRNDHWVPPQTSVAYFDALTAPSKLLVWFEESGHEPFADEPEKFNSAMVELVRPAAVAGGDRPPRRPVARRELRSV